MKKIDDDVMFYPCEYINNKKSIYLVWFSEGEYDYFKLNHQGKLLYGFSREAIDKLCNRENIKLIWEELSRTDFDLFFKEVNKLSHLRSTSKKACNLILDGWNFIEDILRSFNLKKEEEKLKTPVLNRVYKKIFHGCNLPSITPEGKSYSPAWTAKELQEFKEKMFAVWNFILDKKYLI